jgi:hypothetical protein
VRGARFESLEQVERRNSLRSEQHAIKTVSISARGTCYPLPPTPSHPCIPSHPLARHSACRLMNFGQLRPLRRDEQSRSICAAIKSRSQVARHSRLSSRRDAESSSSSSSTCSASLLARAGFSPQSLTWSASLDCAPPSSRYLRGILQRRFRARKQDDVERKRARENAFLSRCDV